MKNKVIVSMLAITLAAGISIGTTNASTALRSRHPDRWTVS